MNENKISKISNIFVLILLFVFTILIFSFPFIIYFVSGMSNIPRERLTFQAILEFAIFFVFFPIIAFGIFTMIIIQGILSFNSKNRILINQFIGFLLVLFGFLLFAFPFSLISLSYIFSCVGSILLVSILVIVGLAISVYYELKIKNKNILLEGIVVEEGKKISEMLNGYSLRPFSKNFEELKVNNFEEISKSYSKYLQEKAVLYDFEFKENIAIYYPMLMPKGFKQALTIYNPIYSIKVVWKLLFKKEKLSWIKLSNNGKAIIYISKDDYERIEKPVSYHILCENLLNRFVNGFTEFGKGNVESSVKNLKGS